MKSFVGVLGVLLAAGCAPVATNANAGNESATTFAVTTTFKGPDDFVHCSMKQHTISCQMTPLPAGFPLQIENLTAIMLDNAPNGAGQLPDLELKDGNEHALGTAVGSSAFVVLMPKFVAQDGVTTVMQQSEAVDSLEDSFELDEGNTLTLPLPLDVWPLGLVGTGTFTQAGTDVLMIDPTPWKTSTGKTSIQRVVAFPTKNANEVDLMLVLTRGTTSVTGRGLFCDQDGNGCIQQSFALDGAGYFDVSQNGLARTDGPPASSATPDMAQPVDPDPTCGGDHQAPCANDTCDPHTVLFQGPGLCFSCGANGQTSCANETCDPHTVYLSGPDTCVSCGANGQTSCANSKCDPHTVYLPGSDMCTSCGATGQPACDGGVCDPGLTDFSGACS